MSAQPRELAGVDEDMEMTFRIKSAVAVAAFLSLMLLGACGPTEEVSGDIGSDTTTSSDTGSTEVDLSTVNLMDAIDVQMAAAAADGHYDCCLEVPCSMCLVMMGGCPCHENAESGEPVCRECKGGWDAGGGHIDGMTTDDINVMPPLGDGM